MYRVSYNTTIRILFQEKEATKNRRRGVNAEGTKGKRKTAGSRKARRKDSLPRVVGMERMDGMGLFHPHLSASSRLSEVQTFFTKATGETRTGL
jgi:hypothetical protein